MKYASDFIFDLASLSSLEVGSNGVRAQNKNLSVFWTLKAQKTIQNDECIEFVSEFKTKVDCEVSSKYAIHQKNTVVSIPNSRSKNSEPCVLKLSNLMNPNNGYVKNGKVTIQVTVEIEPANRLANYYMEQYMNREIIDKMDLAFLADNVHLAAMSKMLMEKSNWFADKLRNGKCTKADNVRGYMSLAFLQLLHNRAQLTDSNIETTLEHCVTYDCPVEIQQCEKYIIESTTIPMIQKLKYAFDSGLERLKNHCLYQLKNESERAELMKSDDYKTLTNESLRLTLLELSHVRINEPEVYMINGKVRDFKKSKEWLTDAVLVVDGTKFHVTRQILRFESSVFHEMFRENEQLEKINAKNEYRGSMLWFLGLPPKPLPSITQLTISDTNSHDFDEFLQMIYQPTNYVTCSNFKSMLELSYRFKVPFIMEKCEKYLIAYPYMELIDKLIYAGIYPFDDLIQHCLIQIKTKEDLGKLKTSGKFDQLSAQIIKKIMAKIQ